VSDGHNLVGQLTDFSHITAANGVSGDQIGSSGHPMNPKLGALADNGGPTETMALLAGSPAIDSGSNSAAPSTDQRGDSRVGTADIGAFERQANHAPVFGTTPLGLATAGLPFTATVTATDTDHDAVTISSVNKPSWMSVHDNGNGTATLTGTPSYLNGGHNSVALSVGDGITSVGQTFNFGVSVPPVVLDGNGLMSVYGTLANDTLQVWVRTDGKVRVSSNGALRNYPLASVHSVQVYGMDGDDSITLNLKTIPGYVLGGTGDDTLLGGDEADTLTGAAGNDMINGGAGNDKLNGDGGTDQIHGDAGNDVLDGGDGHDRLWGDAGNDTIYSQDGLVDRVDGGSGVNKGRVENIDSFVNVQIRLGA
jgi:Ca2+-binding RTX toxin-like protein